MEADSGDKNIDTVEIVRKFNHALNQRDIETMMVLMAEDCLFENTYPPPDGSVYRGKEQVRSFWEEFFKGADRISIRAEELFSQDDRCVMRWVYAWENSDGDAGHIRGVDLYRLHGGLILEKLSYVKG